MQEVQRTDRLDDSPSEAPAGEVKGQQRKSAARSRRPPRGQAQVPAGASEAPEADPTPKADPAEALRGYTPRLKERYKSEIVPTLMREFSYGNVMEVPKVSKVVLNIGLGEAQTNPKAMESAERDLATITGQHPVTTKAKKSVAAFKIRKGMSVGMMVTLRGDRMYEFLDRFLHVALPRIRDFRGAPTNGFDGRGNYSLGLREQVNFPEIDYNLIDRIRGLQVTIATTAETDEAAKRLLDLLGMAFVRERAGAAT